jgi:SOS response regulatory protein OraA/RecX
VARAGLRVGTALDRPRARAVRQELRRAEALDAAARSLRTGDRSRAELVRRLERRRLPTGARAEAVETLERLGLVDDRRAAEARAAALASRGYGDAAIRYDLGLRGFDDAAAADALASLEPERARAERLVRRRGAGPATARSLAARGFGEDAVEAAAAGAVAGDT